MFPIFGKKYVIAAFLVGSAILVATAGTIFWDTLNESEGTEIDMSAVVPVSGDALTPKADKLRVGMSSIVAEGPSQDAYGKLLRLVASQVGREPTFVRRRTYAETNKLLKYSQVDVAFVCSAPYVQGHDDYGLELLAVPVYDGKATYQSLIIVAKDSKIESVDDLEGKRFAFTDPASATGTIYPEFMLLQRDKKVDTFFADTTVTFSHGKSIRAVATGLTDAAAVSSIVWGLSNTRGSKDSFRTRIIAKSEPIAVSPVVVPPDLDPALKSKLADAFLQLHRSKEGAAVLAGLGIDRFERGQDSDYDGIRAMLDTVARSRN